MFFLIGGVQPKTTTLDQTPWICPACGVAQARLKRTDQYVSLFFIPLFPVKKGNPVLVCGRCGVISSPDLNSRRIGRELRDGCPRCKYPVEPGYRFCPGCGGQL
ncbi:MAG: zinc ribbon domain-containing protein [Desulfobacteraceae bacterium]|nr:zinc ribbon domain-containing protein [Desulfobacteraceae bacterium]